MTASKPLTVAFCPVVIDGKWFFCRTQADAVTRLRGCATCEGHGSPGDATAHYVMTEPPADESGHEMQ